MSFCPKRGCECSPVCFWTHEKRIKALETQLAEERAKREAIARQLPGSGQVADIDESLSNLLSKVADYRSREGVLTSRADRAERELAEERERRVRAETFMGFRAYAELEKRAEKAEARVAELEGVKATLISGMNAQTKAVAELHALMDAATHLEFGHGYEAQPHAPSSKHPYWWVSKDGDGVCYMLLKEKAIALARDLAAKEKEPTR
jgi:DNA repair exonuclease SbcCD ATPase subunit